MKTSASSENRITVITSITGGYDELREDQVTGAAKFICYTDKPIRSKTWDIQPAYGEFKDPKLNSRVHKILAPRFVDTEFGIWIDGSVRLVMQPEEIIKLVENDVAVFEHYQMPGLEPFTVHQELQYCKKVGKGDANYLNMQLEELPEESRARAYMCGIIVFKATDKTRRLFDAWWAEFTKYPTRDQISFFKVFHGHVDIINISSNKVFEHKDHYALLGTK